MLRTISIILLTTIHGLPAWADDCAEWKTPAFFVTASPDEIIACLQVDSKIDARNKRGLTPLHMASANSSVPAVIEALLANGAEIRARDINGWTPLHWAAAYNSSSVIDALFRAGADITRRGEGGLTPLHLAAASNEAVSVIEMLIAAGSDVAARDDDGLTPLHMAAANNSSAAIPLLAANAEIEARDKNGWTPLHWAASKEVNLATRILKVADKEIATGKVSRYSRWLSSGLSSGVEVLLAAGANTSAKDSTGKTPFDHAQENEIFKKTDGFWLLNDARFGVISKSIMVGSCPTPIKVSLKGIWHGAVQNSESSDILRRNPARKATIAAVYDAERPETLNATVLSLNSVEKFQGDINSETFEKLASTMASLLGSPSSEFLDELKMAVDERAATYGENVTFSLSDNIESGDDFVTIYGQSQAAGGVKADVAGMFRRIAGCVINVNFSILSGEESPAQLYTAVHDFHLDQ